MFFVDHGETGETGENGHEKMAMKKWPGTSPVNQSGLTIIHSHEKLGHKRG